MENMDSGDFAIFLLTIILPPLGVFFKVGLGFHFWVNLLLTIFGFWICGLVHGIYVVLNK
jgi:uncharacterized membrane protein YqaE (UPF0057 family)